MLGLVFNADDRPSSRYYGYYGHYGASDSTRRVPLWRRLFTHR